MGIKFPGTGENCEHLYPRNIPSKYTRYTVAHGTFLKEKLWPVLNLRFEQAI